MNLIAKDMDVFIVYVVLFCRQNIAFVGIAMMALHGVIDLQNKVNFKAVLEYRALGDTILKKKHLTDGQCNVQYTGPETQDKIFTTSSH